MPDRPTCQAHGFDRYHHAVRADLTYGGGGWFVLFNGVSSTPKKIAFTCSLCGETFETTRDPEVLKQYRKYPYVRKPADVAAAPPSAAPPAGGRPAPPDGA